MNLPIDFPLTTVEDVQNTPDIRRLAIDQVGIKGIRHPISIPDNTGAIQHSVESTGSPSFTSSAILTGNGMTHEFEFTQAGTYTYQCAVHGAAMTGTVVVQ